MWNTAGYLKEYQTGPLDLIIGSLLLSFECCGLWKSVCWNQYPLVVRPWKLNTFMGFGSSYTHSLAKKSKVSLLTPFTGLGYMDNTLFIKKEIRLFYYTLNLLLFWASFSFRTRKHTIYFNNRLLNVVTLFKWEWAYLEWRLIYTATAFVEEKLEQRHRNE